MTTATVVRCISCGKDVSSALAFECPGPELEIEGLGRGRQVVYACSPACRDRHEGGGAWKSPPPQPPNETVLAFHAEYRGRNPTITWLGVPLWKNPCDLLVYQEIIRDVRPDLIIETGTHLGGSALFLASMLDLVHGQAKTGPHVLSIDSVKQEVPAHPRIQYLHGDSVDYAALATVGVHARDRRVMVVLDSDHSKNHVLAELRAYAPFVSPGSYLVVEDTDVNGHPIHPEHSPGPAEAVEEFLTSPDGVDFAVDSTREKFLLTYNRGGYLRRVRGAS